MRDDSTSSRRLSASTGLTEVGEFGLLTEDDGGLVERENGLVRRAVGQADPALEAVAERADGFQDNRLGEMAGQVDASADRKVGLGHSRSVPRLGTGPHAEPAGFDYADEPRKKL